MDDRIGQLYDSDDAALAAGVPKGHIVQLSGTRESIERVSRKVRLRSKLEAARRKKARQQARISRKANRGR